MLSRSNQSPCLVATFRRHEGDKCRAYEKHMIRDVEQGSFMPLRLYSPILSGAWVKLPLSHINALTPSSVFFGYGMAALFRGSRSRSGSPY